MIARMVDARDTQQMPLPAAGPAVREGRVLLWIAADGGDDELALARAAVANRATIVESPSPARAVADAPSVLGAASPSVAILASDGPGRWTVADAVLLTRRWPLTPVVSVAGSLADGRRRSGPALPGVEEVPWSDFPSRLTWWLAELDRGRPGPLGMPTTARRDERLVESTARIAAVSRTRPGLRISVAAQRASDVEPLCDLVAAAGHCVVRRTEGRPAVEQDADVLVWDTGHCDATTLSWLAMLAANRVDLAIVMLESFPRSETSRRAVATGAAAVLSRPLSLEALVGTLERLQPAAVGLGGPGLHG